MSVKVKKGDTVKVNLGDEFQSYVGTVLSVDNKMVVIRNLADDVWLEPIETVSVI